MDSKIVHRFFKVRASGLNDQNKVVRGIGHVCVALRPMINGNGFRVGLSFKSPVDSKDIELGQKIADGRLISRKSNRNFIVRAKTSETAFKQAVQKMFSIKRKVNRRGEMVSRPFVPDWLHNAVMEQQHELTVLKV
jgi:hypothetical protein